MSTLDPLHLSKDMPVDTTVPGRHHTWGSMSSLIWVGDPCSSFSTVFTVFFLLKAQALKEGLSSAIVSSLVGEAVWRTNPGR